MGEFLPLPETKPASEYIEGQIIQKPMPQGKHSSIQGEMVPAINAVIKPQRLGRAFPEFRCTYPSEALLRMSMAIAQRFLIFLFLLGKEFPVIRMGRLPIHSRSLQIG
jgi:hypothetical protein